MERIGQDFSDFMKEQGFFEKAQKLAYKRVITAKSKMDVERNYSPELRNNLLKLDEIKSLKKNWNNNQAKPISRKLLNKTKSLIINLEKQPQIFPTANDSIQMEYDGADNSYLELQITNKNNLSYYRVDKNGKETTGTIPISSFTLNALVKEFYE